MKRLYEAADALQGLKTQAEVARALNQSSQTINNWEARGISKPGLLRAQAVLGVSATWIEVGVGAMALANNIGGPPSLNAVEGSYRDVESFNAGNPDVVHIPKVTISAQAGVTGFSVEDHNGDPFDSYPIERSWIERMGFRQERLFAMKVKGYSMEPKLYEGDIIVVNTADTHAVDGDPYVVNFGGEVVVKRMLRDGGEWWLMSDNPEPQYHRRRVQNKETIIIGKVVKRDTTRI